MIDTSYNSLYNSCIEISRKDKKVKFSFLDKCITAKCKTNKKYNKLKEISIDINKEIISHKSDRKIIKQSIKAICLEKLTSYRVDKIANDQLSNNNIPHKRKHEASEDISTKRNKTAGTEKSGFGIANGGNTCYLNATLQALQNQSLRFNYQKITKENCHQGFAKQKFMQFFPDVEQSQISEESIFQFGLKIDQTREQLLQLMKTLKTEQVSSNSINALRDLLIDCGFSIAKNKSQVDAAEVFGVIVRILGLAPFNHYIKLSHLDRFAETTDEATSLMLSLDVKLQFQIDHLFEFTDTELPNMLPIQLKRYDEKLTKIKKPFEIESELTLKNIENSTVQYNLTSVVIHKGDTPLCGHYYTYVKKNEVWYKFDDEKVTACNLWEIMNDIETDGYLLFYKKNKD